MSEDITTSSTHERNLRKRWEILGVIYLGILTFGVVMQSVPPILNLVISEFGLMHSQAGLLMSFFALPGIVVSIPAGILADRYNPKIIVLISLALVTGGAAIVASAASFPVLVIGRTISGIGAVPMLVVLPKLITHWFKEGQLGIAMGLFNTGVPLGTVLSMNLLAILAQNIGWRTGIWVSGAVALLALLVFAWFYTPAPRENKRPAAPSEPPESVSQSLKQNNSRIWLIGTAWLLFNAAILSFFTFTPDLLTISGFSIAKAGFLTGLVMWPALIVSPTVGILIDKVGHKRMIVATGGFALAVLIYSVPSAAGWIFILMLLIGIFQSLVPAPIFALPADFINPEKMGYAYGIITVCSSLGIVAGPALTGWLRDITGSYQVSYGLASVFAVLILVTMFLLRAKPAH